MTVNSQFINFLNEEITVGLRENNSFYNYETEHSPCILSTYGHRLNLLFRLLFEKIISSVFLSYSNFQDANCKQTNCNVFFCSANCCVRVSAFIELPYAYVLTKLLPGCGVPAYIKVHHSVLCDSFLEW